MPRKRPNATNHWDVHLCGTCFEVPDKWCLAFFCPPCVAFKQRIEVLDNNMDSYVCCGGMYGDCCKFVSDPCPTCCLGIESCICFWCAISANRFLIQNKYDVRNTCCEECLIWTACIFSFVWCIVSMFLPANAPDEAADLLVDCGYLALSACFQSQQQHELEYQKTGKSLKRSRNDGNDAL